MKFIRIAAAVVLGLVLVHARGEVARAQSAPPGGTWTTMVAPFRVQDAMLMMDGTVLAEQYTTGSWWRLTPDASGDYVHGTWSAGPVSTMPAGYAPLYYCSAVLPDGRLVIMGGEYNFQGGTYVANEQNKGAIYDPITNTWANLPPPAGVNRIGDSMCSVLPTGAHAGQLALGTNNNSAMYALNPTTLTWTSLAPTGKTPGDSNSEEGWTLLPDGTFFVVNANTGMAGERYLPTQNKWFSAGTSPVPLRDSGSHETGAQVLMYNGKVFTAGADRNTGANAVFTPPASTVTSPSTAVGTWAIAPPFPRKPYAVAPPMTNCTGTAPNLMCQLDDADAPGVVLPNGHVLVPAAPGVFNADTYFFEYNPDDNSLTEVARPANAGTKIQYAYHMLLLPTGQVFAPDASTQVQIYTMGAGGPDPSWAPAVTSVSKSLKAGQSYLLSGTQLNGLNEGAYYGDDYSSSTNYPIVKITNHATGHVFWGRTHDRDNLNITPGGTIITTYLDIPANLEHGTSDLVVIANGIPSAAVELNHPPVTAASLSGTAGSGGYYTSDVQVTLSATDPDGDLAASFYTVDGGSAQTYSGPFTVSGDGVHHITYWSVDQADNAEAANAATIMIDTTAPSLTVSASLTSLWAPNHKMVDDVISGTFGDGGAGIDLTSATFAVTDEYGVIQPSGAVTVNPDGTFSFTVSLEASRLGSDHDGRKYTITVRGSDLAGNFTSASVVVIVPHDQGGGD